MNNWTKSYSSLELLESLRQDLEMLGDSDLDPDNIGASLTVVDALIERLGSLPSITDEG